MLRKRDLYKAVEKHFEEKTFTIISGARQTGKTSLLRMLFADLKERGEEVYFLSFENPQILEAVDGHPDRIFMFTGSKPLPVIDGQQQKRLVLLIDEVQYAEKPAHFLKYLYDTYEGNLKIIATGSSAFYIDRQFKDSLAGRKRVFVLYPLSFSEMLHFKDAQYLLDELLMLRKREDYISPYMTDLRLMFYEYLTYGGYPAVVLQDDESEKKFLLEELKNSYVKRDLLESGVSMESKFYLLFQLLADQVGNLLNKQELARTIQVDNKTIDHYLYVLEKCFHIVLVRPYYRNLRKELIKMPKVFFNDIGLRNALLNRFSAVESRADKGALLEQYYFMHLRLSYPLDQIHYWRTTTGDEIDFVLESGFEEGLAIEVKWNKKNFKPKQLDKFLRAYPRFKALCYDVDRFFLV